jgi:hypothetical protein
MDEEQGSFGQTYAKDYAGELKNHVGAIESDLGAGPTGIYSRWDTLDDWLPRRVPPAPIGAPLLERSPERVRISTL